MDTHSPWEPKYVILLDHAQDTENYLLQRLIIRIRDRSAKKYVIFLKISSPTNVWVYVFSLYRQYWELYSCHEHHGCIFGELMSEDAYLIRVGLLEALGSGSCFPIHVQEGHAIRHYYLQSSWLGFISTWACDMPRYSSPCTSLSCWLQGSMMTLGRENRQDAKQVRECRSPARGCWDAKCTKACKLVGMHSALKHAPCSLPMLSLMHC